MNKISELDQAQLRHSFRNMYKDIGIVGCYQVLYEFLLSANLLMDVMNEEILKKYK